MTESRKPRLLTGDRPTGPLHLGHLVGTLQSRVQLQDSHECFVIVADLHSLTTRWKREQITELPARVRGMVLDLLGVGIDPARSTIYLQSGVPAVYDLTILLQMLTPVARLSKIETIKDMAHSAGLEDSEVPLGLLGYPVLQAADILMANAELVPVGGDNETHVHVARELAEHFNEAYGHVFAVPQPTMSTTPSLPGVNTIAGGSERKMSKSLGNTINLGDSPEEVARKLAPSPAPPPASPAARPSSPSPRPSSPTRPRACAATTTAAPSASPPSRTASSAPSTTCSRRSASAGPASPPTRAASRRSSSTAPSPPARSPTRPSPRSARPWASSRLWAGLVQATQARAEARKKPFYQGGS
jgi:tryptophanyl-tRNA synthetase